MELTCTILFTMFTLLALIYWRKFLFDKLNITEVGVWLLSNIISAVTAGVLWGGLKIG